MNGYLVMALCKFTSQPLRLCRTRQQALKFARSVTYDRDRSDAPKKERGCLGPPGVFDRLLYVGIIRFSDGVPGQFEAVAATEFAR